MHCEFSILKGKMLLVLLCVVGTALAAPAITEETMLPAESHVYVAPYISYSAPILRSLDVMVEPEPKIEEVELAEPKEEFTEAEEPREELSEATELPKIEELKPVIVKLDVTKPPSFISNWFSSLPSLPSLSLPSFITNWFPSSSRGRLVYPAPYYPGYTAPLIVRPAAV